MPIVAMAMMELVELDLDRYVIFLAILRDTGDVRVYRSVVDRSNLAVVISRKNVLVTAI